MWRRLKLAIRYSGEIIRLVKIVVEYGPPVLRWARDQEFTTDTMDYYIEQTELALAQLKKLITKLGY